MGRAWIYCIADLRPARKLAPLFTPLRSLVPLQLHVLLMLLLLSPTRGCFLPLVDRRRAVSATLALTSFIPEALSAKLDVFYFFLSLFFVRDKKDEGFSYRPKILD